MTSQKPSEAGWFYHAPAKKVWKDPVGAPPPSQIPGLGNIEPLEREVPREMMFRETDTEYIRKAKMGGSKDLLTIRPNPEGKKAPVGYPRSEWFYLEDNALEDKDKQQEQWQFLLPEYMVHQEYGNTTANDRSEEAYPQLGDPNTVPMRRAPFATDENMAQFNQDGRAMTDKTARIPEMRRPGFGVRNGKPPPKGPVAQVPDREKPTSSQVQGQRPRLKYQPMLDDDQEPTSMAKLISNTYDKEWHQRLDKWQGQQNKNREKSQAFVKSEEGPMCSEYHRTYSNHSKSSANPSKGLRGAGENGSAKEASAKKEEVKEKEPFKLSKFKNVPSRINTHQSPEVLARVGN